MLLARTRLCPRCLEQLVRCSSVFLAWHRQIAALFASGCLNPKSVLAALVLRLLDISVSQYMMLPLNELTCVFICSFTSFCSLTLLLELAIILLNSATPGNASSGLGKTFGT